MGLSDLFLIATTRDIQGPGTSTSEVNEHQLNVPVAWKIETKTLVARWGFTRPGKDLRSLRHWNGPVEIANFPIKHGDFLYRCVELPEGRVQMSCQFLRKKKDDCHMLGSKQTTTKCWNCDHLPRWSATPLTINNSERVGQLVTLRQLPRWVWIWYLGTRRC